MVALKPRRPGCGSCVRSKPKSNRFGGSVGALNGKGP